MAKEKRNKKKEPQGIRKHYSDEDLKFWRRKKLNVKKKGDNC